jgi:protein-ribulosamine 3-kinase
MIEIAAPSLAPRVFKVGSARCKYEEDGEEDEEEERPYMISEYKFLQPLQAHHALALAKRLALELHAYKSIKGLSYGVLESPSPN